MKCRRAFPVSQHAQWQQHDSDLNRMEPWSLLLLLLLVTLGFTFLLCIKMAAVKKFDQLRLQSASQVLHNGWGRSEELMGTSLCINVSKSFVTTIWRMFYTADWPCVMASVYFWKCSIPSALESIRLGVKSWLWRIFSTTSSASTLVSSILFSWDSIEFCFTGCLRGGYRTSFYVHLLLMPSSTNWRCCASHAQSTCHKVLGSMVNQWAEGFYLSSSKFSWVLRWLCHKTYVW